MPHIAFVPFTGLRVRAAAMLELGMRLPGLKKRADALAELPALGLLTLAGMTPNHWEISYHPSNASGGLDELIDQVIGAKPDLVAVSALTASVLEAYKFCRRMKQAGIQTVIGGLHVTVLPEEAALHATSVCVGDGESSWLKILSDAESGSMSSVYRPEKKFQLTEAPTPRFDLLDSNPKRSGALTTTKIPQRWTIQTQRGCPWACEFCAASRLLGPPRYKPITKIAAELTAIGEMDSSPWVELADDNSFAGRKDTDQLLETIAAANIRYFTENDWRVGTDAKLVRKIAESGCVQILLGVESLEFRYPGMGRKQTDLSQICDAIDTIQEAGIVVNGCFIVGADGETQDSLDRLIEFIDRSSLAEIQITLQTPFPGTGLYRRMKKANQLLDRDWSYYTLFDVVYQPDQLSVEQLEAGFVRVVKEVFSEPGASKRASLRRRIWHRHPCMRNNRD